MLRGGRDRDWPDQGMTTDLWRAIEPCPVEIDQLHPTQPGVLFAAICNPRIRDGGDTLPHVVEWRGDLYLEDGHHRVVRAALDGARTIFVRKLRIA